MEPEVPTSLLRGTETGTGSSDPGTWIKDGVHCALTGLVVTGTNCYDFRGDPVKGP